MKELHNLNFLQEQWDFFALASLASSWLGVQFFLQLHAATQKVDPFSLDIRGSDHGLGGRRELAGVLMGAEGGSERGTRSPTTL